MIGEKPNDVQAAAEAQRITREANRPFASLPTLTKYLNHLNRLEKSKQPIE